MRINVGFYDPKIWQKINVALRFDTWYNTYAKNIYILPALNINKISLDCAEKFNTVNLKIIPVTVLKY